MQFTVCEYLHEFSESMEGTRDGMTLALPTPECDSEGNYLAMQCSADECWCVDHFGTEIPKTKGKGNYILKLQSVENHQYFVSSTKPILIKNTNGTYGQTSW